MILLDINGSAIIGLIIGVLLIANIPPIVFLLIGYAKRKKNPNTSKTFYKLAIVWIVLEIIGLGSCFSMF